MAETLADGNLRNSALGRLWLYDALDRLGSQVLAALALHIGLPRGLLRRQDRLRQLDPAPIHYPPITTPDIPTSAPGAHEDINLYHAAGGCERGGLEVKSQPGEWVPFTSDAEPSS
jgi:isopenicillin N synthase-like dioxygenase